MKPINEILKELRDKNHHTQQVLAEALNLKVSSYGKKELGKADISLSQLESISNFYKMSVLELLAYPDAVTINKQPIHATVQILVDVVSPRQKEKLIEVLDKIEEINVEINNEIPQIIKKE